jgi:hypothetical protein
MTTYQKILNYLSLIVDPSTGQPYYNNPSAIAIYKKIADALAPIIDSTIAEGQNTEAIIQDVINNQRYGKSGYYTSKALAFQYGSALTQDPITFDTIYSVVAPVGDASLIIKQAAFELSGSNSLVLKVAKLSGGILVKLASAEKTDFDSYFLNFEIPGLPVTKISIDANIINLTPSIIYDSNYDITNLIAAVGTAIITFQTTFPFNGYFYKNGIYGLENYLIANVSGLIDVSLSNLSMDSSSFATYVKLPAGYFNWDAAAVAAFANSSNYSIQS